MEAKATASMPQREQSHPAFFVVNGACKLPGTSHHKLPSPRQHHRIGKRLHQARRRRKSLDTARDVHLGRKKVGDWSTGSKRKLTPD